VRPEFLGDPVLYWCIATVFVAVGLFAAGLLQRRHDPTR